MSNGNSVTNRDINISTNTKHVIIAVVGTVGLFFSLFLFLRSEWRDDIIRMAYAQKDGIELKGKVDTTKETLDRIELKFDMAILAALPNSPKQEK